MNLRRDATTSHQLLSLQNNFRALQQKNLTKKYIEYRKHGINKGKVMQSKNTSKAKLIRRNCIILSLIFLISITLISASASPNKLRPILPELSISSSDIIPSKYNATEGENITIQATIHNNGRVGAYFIVEFFDGHPKEGSEIGSADGIVYGKSQVGYRESNLNITNTTTVSITWQAVAGEHVIYVLIKESFPHELNPHNNIANATITVSANEPVQLGESVSEEENFEDSTIPKSFVNEKKITFKDDTTTTTIGMFGIITLLLLSTENNRYLAFKLLLPLYTRLGGDKLLANKMRRKIFKAIASNPGIHFSSLMETLNLKNGVLAYHLSVLEKEDYISSTKEGLYRRFWAKTNSYNVIQNMKKGVLSKSTLARE